MDESLARLSRLVADTQKNQVLGALWKNRVVEWIFSATQALQGQQEQLDQMKTDKELMLADLRRHQSLLESLLPQHFRSPPLPAPPSSPTETPSSPSSVATPGPARRPSPLPAASRGYVQNLLEQLVNLGSFKFIPDSMRIEWVELLNRCLTQLRTSASHTTSTESQGGGSGVANPDPDWVIDEAQERINALLESNSIAEAGRLKAEAKLDSFYNELRAMASKL